jgi:TetR/AcrR family transcriptional regulator, transcriptional repressor for nem operon
LDAIFPVPRPQAFDSDAALNAALQTFWRCGYNGSSVQSLLDAMGLNRGSLYNSFGDKQSLFCASIERYYQRVTRLVVMLLEQTPHPVQGIVAVFELSLIALPELERRKGCLLVNTAAELAEAEPELARQALLLLRNVRNGFAQALRRADAAGFWSRGGADPELAADLLFNFLTGLRITARFEIEPDQVRANVLQTLHMLGLETGGVPS